MSDLQSMEIDSTATPQRSRIAVLAESVLARFAFAHPTDNYIALQAQRYHPSRLAMAEEAAANGAEAALQCTVDIEVDIEIEDADVLAS